MNIKTKFSHTEQLVSDRGYLSMGVGPTIPYATYVLYFNGDGAEVSIKLSNQSELYDKLGVFAHTNNNNFVFNITGKHVDTAYQKEINKLKKDKQDIFNELEDTIRVSKSRLKIILDQQTSVNELYALKRKWWYKLFTWSW